MQVLDKGFVELVDHMGDDNRIVQAARVSTGRGLKDPETDKKLLRSLMRRGHTSPFEKVRFEFHCKMPLFIARQWIRHRTGSFNEISGRYAEVPRDYYVPEQWRKQSKSDKQGSDVDAVPQDAFNTQMTTSLVQHSEECFALYDDMLNHGVAREMARMVLPLNMYTQWYWTVDLHNLFHFLQLRMDSHAQWEFQQYAHAIMELIEPIVPWSVEAFRDFRLDAVTFNRNECDIAHALGDLMHDCAYVNEACERYGLSRTEEQELKEKWSKFSARML